MVNPPETAASSHVRGEETRDKRTLLRCLFRFFFLHKNSPFIQVFSSTSTLERSFIIFFWAQKKCDEGGTDRLSTSAVRIDLFNYFINSYVTSITHRDTTGHWRPGWGPARAPARTPHPMSQNQTVKCTLLLSINREATLKKNNNTVVKGCWNQEKNNERKREELKRRAGPGLGQGGAGRKSCIELRGMWSDSALPTGPKRNRL